MSTKALLAANPKPSEGEIRAYLSGNICRCMQEPRHPILAHGKARYVGDPICAVIAQTLEQARDAAEAIDLGMDELPAVINMKDALKDGATKVHDDLTSNLCYDWGFVEKNRDVVDAAIKDAHHVTTLELKNNRLIANPVEPRVAIGVFDRITNEHTLYISSQNPHVIRLLTGPLCWLFPNINCG